VTTREGPAADHKAAGPFPLFEARVTKAAKRSRQNDRSPRRGPVEYPQLLFARRKATLARRGERAARVGPNRINRAAIVTTEVLAAFVLSEDQHQLSVVPPGKWRTCEVAPSSLLEASDVTIFELDLVVLATGAALEAVELELTGRSFVYRITLRPLANDPVSVVRHSEVSQPRERPAARGEILRAPQVEDGPPSEVALVARSRLGENEPGLPRGEPHEGMATSPNPLSRLLAVRPVVGSDHGANEEHWPCSNTAPRRTRGSSHMRAVVIREPGDPDVLEIREVPVPEPSRGEVRVRVRATAVNRADILQRLGKYPAPNGWPAQIPGMEIAGEVDALGDGVDELHVGDRVLGVVGGGGYAEYVVLHARALAHLGELMPFTDAAAIPEAFLTAWDAIVTQALLAAGETLLVHAVASGVGTAAVQIANALGATTIGTARTPDKLLRVQALGLTHGVHVRNGRFVEEVLARTSGLGVDVVLDLVGGDYVGQDIECIKTKGRVVVASTAAGSKANVDLGALLQKRAIVRGTMLRSRPLEEKILLAQTLERNLLPLFALGRLRPVIDRVLKLEDAPHAHRLVQSNETVGKVVLEVG
jgi:NADPH2:quinone reductase